MRSVGRGGAAVGHPPWVVCSCPRDWGAGGRHRGPQDWPLPTVPVSGQVVYYSEMHKIFGDLTQQLEQPGHSDEQRERENEAKLSELRALSIVADD